MSDNDITLANVSDEYDLAKVARSLGSHFFDADTMRFFKSRIGLVFAVDATRAVFVTSEKRDGQPRAYTVRVATIVSSTRKCGQCIDYRFNTDDDGKGFQGYATNAQANKAARALAASMRGVK